MTSKNNQPVLRWAGGKWRLVKLLKKYLPEDLKTRFYCEPFLGAGSLFFSIEPNKGLVSDANQHLIECFKNIQENPRLVSFYLLNHLRNNSDEYYYQIRDKYNRFRYRSNPAQAARFIYLNRTCFNGIYRVNLQGEFNVPYGWKEPPRIPPYKLLEKASKTLANVSIQALSFEESIENLPKNSFIYLDPPYPPLNGTSNFTHYTIPFILIFKSINNLSS